MRKHQQTVKNNYEEIMLHGTKLLMAKNIQPMSSSSSSTATTCTAITTTTASTMIVTIHTITAANSPNSRSPGITSRAISSPLIGPTYYSKNSLPQAHPPVYWRWQHSQVSWRSSQQQTDPRWSDRARLAGLESPAHPWRWFVVAAGALQRSDLGRAKAVVCLVGRTSSVQSV